MKKRVLTVIIAAALLLTLIVPSFAAEEVYSRFNQISTPNAETISTLAENASKMGVEIFYIFTDEFSGEGGVDAAQYAESIVNYYTSSDDYIIYLCLKDDAMIITQGDGTDIYDDDAIDAILWETEPYETADQYEMAAVRFFSDANLNAAAYYNVSYDTPDDVYGSEPAVDSELTTEAEAKAKKEDTADDAETQQVKKEKSGSLLKGILISLAAGLIIGGIVVLIIRGKYKPVQLQRTATDYLVDGSLQITGSYETFVRKNVDRTPIQQNNNNNNNK